jgi:uncharacterized membrane protein
MMTRAFPVSETRMSGNSGEMYSQTEIHAPSEKIWNILIDFTQYPRWNLFIRRIKGTAEEGKNLVVYIKPSGATGMKLKPVLVKVTPFRSYGGKDILWFMACSMGTCFQDQGIG